MHGPLNVKDFSILKVDSRVCFETLCPNELHRVTSLKAVIFNNILYFKQRLDFKFLDGEYSSLILIYLIKFLN